MATLASVCGQASATTGYTELPREYECILNIFICLIAIVTLAYRGRHLNTVLHQLVGTVRGYVSRAIVCLPWAYGNTYRRAHSGASGYMLAKFVTFLCCIWVGQGAADTCNVSVLHGAHDIYQQCGYDGLLDVNDGLVASDFPWTNDHCPYDKWDSVAAWPGELPNGTLQHCFVCTCVSPSYKKGYASYQGTIPCSRTLLVIILPPPWPGRLRPVCS